jgi:uncharacterized membrane protein HdeD (DUF308 family)
VGNSKSSFILAKSWWSLVIRGLAGVSLGIAAVVWRGIPLYDLIMLFFSWAVFDGLVSIAGAVRTAEQGEQGKMLLLLEGVSGIVVALVAVGSPRLADSTLIFLIAAWALITGAIEIAAALHLRRYVTGELLLGMSGMASILLGALMAAVALTAVPSPSIAPWLGIYGFVFGLLLLGLGFRLRSRIRFPAVSPS